MSYKFSVACFFPSQNMRLHVYTGQSLLAAWRAYRKAKRDGGLYFVIEYCPEDQL
jgi:hypothetical protein